MSKDVIVLEDSSKSKLGGGQRITLLVMETLKHNYNLILFDTNNNSIFFDKAKAYTTNTNILITFGFIRSGITGLAVKILEFILFPFLIFLNFCRYYSFFKSRSGAILYATTKKALIYAYLINFLFGNKFIFHAHLVNRTKIARFLNGMILKNASKVISVSNVVKNNIDSNAVINVYNPIVSQSTSSKRKLNKKIIVATFSSLAKIKGVEYFMQSYNYLNTECDVEYWVFGDGPEKKALEKYQSEKVILKGFSENVIADLQNVDILCLPTIIEEAMPVIILEAFSCAIPVVTTDIGGQAELVKDKFNGCLVPIKDPVAIGEKMSNIINDPNLYEVLSNNTLNNLDKYNFDNFEKKISEIFANV